MVIYGMTYCYFDIFPGYLLLVISSAISSAATTSIYGDVMTGKRFLCYHCKVNVTDMWTIFRYSL